MNDHRQTIASTGGKAFAELRPDEIMLADVFGSRFLKILTDARPLKIIGETATVSAFEVPASVFVVALRVAQVRLHTGGCCDGCPARTG